VRLWKNRLAVVIGRLSASLAENLGWRLLSGSTCVSEGKFSWELISSVPASPLWEQRADWKISLSEFGPLGPVCKGSPREGPA
jgi:hypothetical protein